MTIIEIMDRFGISEEFARMMDDRRTPLLDAVMRLGPVRCRLESGKPPRVNGIPAICWSLDGRRVTEVELIEAAGVYSNRSGGRPGRRAGYIHTAEERRVLSQSAKAAWARRKERERANA